MSSSSVFNNIQSNQIVVSFVFVAAKKELREGFSIGCHSQVKRKHDKRLLLLHFIIFLHPYYMFVLSISRN